MFWIVVPVTVLFTDLTDDNFGHVEINKLPMFRLSRPRPMIESNDRPMIESNDRPMIESNPPASNLFTLTDIDLHA